MISESVGSSNPLLSFNGSMEKDFCDSRNTPVYSTMAEPERDKSCYYCRKQGHYAVNCSNKKRDLSSPTDGRSVFMDEEDQSIPVRKCPCGVGTCVIRTSRTENNPGRKFYVCPGKLEMQCNFFQWCDEASFDQWPEVPLSEYPMCPCGAGKCSRFTVKKEGKTKGLPFFVCPVKTGQGSCNFFQWQNISTKTPSDRHLDESKYGQEENQKTGQEDKHGDGNKLEGIVSHVSMIEDSKSPLIRECHVKEEMITSDSVVHDDIISPIRNLTLGNDKITLPVAKAESSYPMCACGAGVCSRVITKEGENKGRSVFVCPVKKGEGACNFSQWDDTLSDVQEDKKHGDDIKLVSPVKEEVRSESSMTRDHVKEEVVRLNSDSMVYSDTVSLIRNLTSTEEKSTTIPVGKAGQCLWCGKEGHWLKECITSNPLCFRCGKSGHWMKYCTA